MKWNNDRNWRFSKVIQSVFTSAFIFTLSCRPVSLVSPRLTGHWELIYLMTSVQIQLEKNMFWVTTPGTSTLCIVTAVTAFWKTTAASVFVTHALHFRLPTKEQLKLAPAAWPQQLFSPIRASWSGHAVQNRIQTCPSKPNYSPNYSVW